METWAKKFHDAPREQRVPFLYLANDILQNSRRKGPEFVNEFWTVLPWVLRDVVDTGDTSVKKVAYRLVRVRLISLYVEEYSPLNYVAAGNSGAVSHLFG